MKRLIRSDEITIDSLIEAIRSSDNVIVFYRSGDRKDGIPCFLQGRGGKYWFSSAIVTYGFTFEDNSLDGCLTKAISKRQLFVIDKDSKELFNSF